MKKLEINSLFDGLTLSILILKPKGKIKGIVQIAHGMAEHKERYFPFMEFLAKHGYIAVIHDHRGHGNSVKRKEDLGYFYTRDSAYIVDDLYQVTEYIKEKYPNLEVALFSHSMGTLVSRCYIEKYDKEIKKLILCGPPTKNNLVDIGILSAKLMILLNGEHHRSNLLQKLTFGSYNQGYKIENSWVCSDEHSVEQYNKDELCGYIFTNNGFLNLYQLMKQAYKKKNFKVQNERLSIFMIAGEKDPVIQSNKKFEQLKQFLNEVGYQKISTKLYSNRRHEILNGLSKEEVYQDVLEFLKDNEIEEKYEK